MPLLRRHVYSPRPPAATWLAWPTLHETLETFPAAGASFCRDTQRLVQQYGRLVTAELRIQTAGQYAGEIRVFVSGSQVAAIPYDSAYTFREVIDELHQRGLRATCRAELDADEEGRVWLHTKPAVRSKGEPFLPPINAFPVELRPRHSQLLIQSRHGNANRTQHQQTALLAPDDDHWALSLDGQTVGFLEPHPYPRLQEALARGFPLSCYAILELVPNGPVRLRAALPDSYSTNS
ncbi:MAG TPA: hypothetical protein VED84_00345 [Acidimicrobiales bacterium]|nr:hypothetical protein [Acidimicrobiales bacterium]